MWNSNIWGAWWGLCRLFNPLLPQRGEEEGPANCPGVAGGCDPQPCWGLLASGGFFSSISRASCLQTDLSVGEKTKIKQNNPKRQEKKAASAVADKAGLV